VPSRCTPPSSNPVYPERSDSQVKWNYTQPLICYPIVARHTSCMLISSRQVQEAPPLPDITSSTTLSGSEMGAKEMDPPLLADMDIDMLCTSKWSRSARGTGCRSLGNLYLFQQSPSQNAAGRGSSVPGFHVTRADLSSQRQGRPHRPFFASQGLGEQGKITAGKNSAAGEVV
jgi:hypothetical protein